MNIFTINQVNQVYVAKDYKETPSVPGDLVVKKTADNKSIYFQHKNATNELVRSDLINLDSIMYTNLTKAAKMAYTLKRATVMLDSAVNNGAPVAGQDYILRVEFDGYIGISPEDSQYWKYASVHAYNGMTAADFYARLAASLVSNMSREAVQLIKVYIGSTEITKNAAVWAVQHSDYSKLPNDGTSIIIEEVEQDWILGTKQQKRLKFNVVPTEIDVVENNVTTPYKWGKVIPSDGATVTNGKLIADYEYFHMGSRGDQYRMVGFPDYVPTKYLVDPANQYDLINIHYFYIGSNESCQKSEKDITLICLNSETSTIVEALNEVLPTEFQLSE